MSLVFRKPLVTTVTTQIQTLNHLIFHLRALFSTKSHLPRIGPYTYRYHCDASPTLYNGRNSSFKLLTSPTHHILSIEPSNVPPAHILCKRQAFYNMYPLYHTFLYRMYPLYHNFVRYIQFWIINGITDSLHVHQFYLPKKIQPIKYNTSPVVHYTTDTPHWPCVCFQYPVKPFKKRETKTAISLLIRGRFRSYFGKLLPYNPST